MLKAGQDFKAYLFAKKILGFLVEVESMDQSKRVEFVEKLKLEKPQDFQKVGEVLLFSIDGANSLEKCQMLGKIYLAFIKTEIRYPDFSSLCSVVDRLNVNIMRGLKIWADDSIEAKIAFSEELEELATYGLIKSTVTTTIDVNDKNRFYVSHDATRLGKLLCRVALCDLTV